MMTGEEIREYVKNGGKLFMVKSVDILRDGGTFQIETDKGCYYLHKSDMTLHSSWPVTDENKLEDSLLIEFMEERIQTYLNELSYTIGYCEKILAKINP